MNMSKIMECESRQLNKMQLLPNSYKKLGFILLIISITALVLLRITRPTQDIFNDICKSLILLSMIIISVTKEKNEDEYTIILRGKSYVLAFIIGAIYAILQPYINLGVAALLSPEKAVFTEMKSFVIIWFMLFIQLGFYYLLRYTR
ncbi:hypothetical protein BH11BAC3_BH11BAC3_08360 [soil metagenome]